MIDRETYQRVLDAHGRRIANRAAFSQMPNGGEQEDGQWATAFYACYSSDEHLPERERSRVGSAASAFDPAGWTLLYAHHPADTNSPMYKLTNGLSKWAFNQLVAAREQWGNWVILFLRSGLVLDTEDETLEAISNDQGEFSTRDGHCLCSWHPGWRGWTAWVQSLSDDEMDAFERVLKWVFADSEQTFRHRWPNPGTPEAEAMIESMKGSK